MANIQKRETKDGNIRYRVQVFVKGYPVQRATFSTKTKAEIWAKRIETELREGKYFQASEAKKHTMAELLDRYIAHEMPVKMKSKQGGILLWWKSQLGDYALDRITPALIAAKRDQIGSQEIKPGKKRAPATVVRYLATLSHVFTVAQNEYNWLEKSPMEKVSKPRVDNARNRFLSDEERERLLAACRNSGNNMLYVIVILAIGTGMRKAEILTLKRADIDLDKGVIYLKNTKNKEPRRVYLRGFVLQVLKKYASTASLDGYIFPSKNGLMPIDIRDPWEKALKEAKIENMKFHDLRHSFASYLTMNKATAMEISTLLGHKNLSMTKRYSHLSEEYGADVVQKMTDKIFGGQNEIL